MTNVTRVLKCIRVLVDAAHVTSPHPDRHLLHRAPSGEPRNRAERRRRRRRLVGRTTTATATAVALLVGAMSSPASAVYDSPDADTLGEYTFTADTETGVVTARLDVSVTADKPSSANYYYYLTGTAVVLPEEAEIVSITNPSGRELTYETDRSIPGVQFLDVSFGRNLLYRQTTHVIIDYTLPIGEARGNDAVRVNDAYIGFPVVVDPLLEDAQVTVSFPGGFDNQSDYSFEEQTTDDGATVLVDDVLDPEFYLGFVSLVNDDALVEATVEVDGATFDVRSWPGDDAWADHVESTLVEGFGPLQEAVGLDWPHDEPVTIFESFTPYLAGYGGWYNDETREIHMGDELDQQLVFHEVSHAWFHHDFFADRWITEGLAEWVAAEAIEAIGEDRPEPPRASPNDEAAQALSRWSDFTIDPDEEIWGYHASWTVTEEIVEEVGEDALRAALAAADGRELAYLGDGDEPETIEYTPTWQEYLDYLERGGDVDGEAMDELFEEWIVSPVDVAKLERRREARTRYDDLVDDGVHGDEAWAAPVSVREAMSEWNFTFAETLMDEAAPILAERDEMLTALEPLDASLPADLEEAFEAADGRLEQVADEVGAAADVAAALRSSHDGLEAATGVFERIGAIGTTLDSDLATAVSAFESGDLDGATDGAERVDAEVADLAGAGQLRAGIAAAVALFVVAVGVVLGRRRRAASADRDEAGGSGGRGFGGPDDGPSTGDDAAIGDDAVLEETSAPTDRYAETTERSPGAATEVAVNS